MLSQRALFYREILRVITLKHQDVEMLKEEIRSIPAFMLRTTPRVTTFIDTNSVYKAENSSIIGCYLTHRDIVLINPKARFHNTATVFHELWHRVQAFTKISEVSEKLNVYYWRSTGRLANNEDYATCESNAREHEEFFYRYTNRTEFER